jgi:chemotaxis family two-component system response regulator Rcp1
MMLPLSSQTLEGAYRMPATSPGRPVEILLVEDTPDDADLMIEALKEGTFAPRVTVVEDGEEAMDYLHRHGAYAAALTPDLILLDLHLPRKNGHEVLAEIKEDTLLRRIPVVILTASDNETAILKAYDLRANCCVTKPANLEQFALAVKRIETFWLQTVRHAWRDAP